ncbi:magnesium transporter [Roseobacter sp. HKCCD9010]|uniref:magnesium transporter n=1 Tax=unclassified Roseobacter TaxID=196798 RepID=UPI001491FDD6|nr:MULTISPECIES: magnesium transporter [unclassified Roseobacter]MBF9049562.1 magnesium transporter [Rhodobacterales bacterium HKCCD4356]NNV11562.1 magnesium transporter [Roseobacter sp. HKCCD7357]NNV15746.1 magnesium transporter [Roseobacter sp. HKCCD8768]NNV25206.1 magnesium transporter [Roseobacter sp. HKCCD8192]NNV29463.1 magnesium transporter [Roseobacter sp. HKCCD9061]
MADEADDILLEEKDSYALDESLRGQVRRAVLAEDLAAIDALMEPLHPADIADLLEQISGAEREALLHLWSAGVDGDVLSELDENLREEVISFLPDHVLAEAVRDLDSDDVVDLVEDLEDHQQEAILGALDDADRAAVEEALSFPEDSAGRLMQREVVRAPEHWTVGEMIDHLRHHKADLPEQFYHVILVDPRMKPTGYVTLGRMLSTPRTTELTEITEDSFRVIPATQPEEEVAYAFNQYHLISAPVVDDDGRLVGAITIDDAMAVLDAEAEEDILRLAGVGEGRLSDRIIDTTRRRFPWLAVNLITAILASLVIAQFEAAIAQLVALAVLMPIVASMGGNAGTQSLTVAVRAIATKDLTRSNLMRVIVREAGVGLINGLIFAVVMGAVGLIWFGSMALGGVIALAMVINLLVAGLAGILVPVTLDRFGVDPALASGAFVTTVTDVVGFFAFLGLAVLVLL